MITKEFVVITSSILIIGAQRNGEQPKARVKARDAKKKSSTAV